MKGAVTALVGSALLLMVSVVADGQSEKKVAKPEEVYAELGQAPEKSRSRVNPLEQDVDALAAGRLLFADHCAQCHGENAEGGSGRKKGPSLRAKEVQSATPGAIFWLLSNGVVRKGMPVWSRLPEPQRWALVRFIKSLGVTESGPVKAGRAAAGTQKP
jgi:mono/diheme cytochrome c family protein